MKESCFACQILDGSTKISGGFLYRNNLWSIEYCVGPLPLGSLILKPVRHILNFSELNSKELNQFSILLNEITKLIIGLTHCDQTYICQWSHQGWQPVHIHFVIQPAWNNQKHEYKFPGPYMQSDMFTKKIFPNKKEIDDFMIKAKELFPKDIFC
jgi:diadenosine tetraphosphate (Ap4A) HIT family hydrolase